MNDLKSVIQGLECRLDIDGSKYKHCLSCNYRHDIDHCEWACKEDDILKDALSILKAQEPRVMALEELDDLRGRGRAVWFEDRDAFAKCQDVFFVVASGIHAYFKGETYSMLKMVDGYGKSWRCWTSRPTDAQREATLWE